MKTNLYIYMAGDNNLDVSARKDINDELLSVDLLKQTNVFVQFDRRPPLPWENSSEFGTQRFEIIKGKRSLLKDLGETNSGDPGVLKSFIKECQQLNKAQKQMAIIWGHGGGYKEKEDFNNESYRWVSIDNSSNDAIDVQELKQSFEGLETTLDVIAFDACLMGVLDFAYVLKDHAKYMVASQAIEPASGWPYKDLLMRLNQHEEPINDELIKGITNDYHAYYLESNKSITLSSIRLDKVELLAKELDKLASLLISQLKTYRTVYQNIVSSVQRFKDRHYIDLMHFVLLCEKYIESKPVKLQIEALTQAFDQAIILNRVKGEKYDNANGLSVLFPLNLNYGLPYGSLMYKKYPNWLKFIELILM